MSFNISIIIPTFNRKVFLHRALQSVQAQYLESDTRYEIIVVDDGSNDGTQTMVQQEFHDVRYYYQENKGVSAARNLGISQAQFDWLALLDSDDVWLPNKLFQQSKLLLSSGLLICHSNETWIRNGQRLNQAKKHTKKGGWIFQHCLPMCLISPSSAVFHKNIIDDVGDFDESLAVCEDYDMWLRMTARYEVGFIDEALIVKYGGHPDQLSKRYWGMDRFRVQALKKILNFNLCQSNAQAAKQTLSSKLHVLMKGAKKHGNKELFAYCQQELLNVKL